MFTFNFFFSSDFLIFFNFIFHLFNLKNGYMLFYFIFNSIITHVACHIGIQQSKLEKRTKYAKELILGGLKL